MGLSKEVKEFVTNLTRPHADTALQGTSRITWF